MDRKSYAILIVFLMLLLSSLSLIHSAEAASFDGSGPYVENLVYKVITQDDEQVLALQNDEIDLIGDTIDPTFFDTLNGFANIEIENSQRNGYGYITINTAKNPFNYTSFRRALAFALDKEAISYYIWNGFSLPQDSIIPNVNPFSVEGQLPYTYYEANIVLGNSLLDDAGFVIDGVTGFRTTPNGDAFDVLVECASSSSIALDCGQKVAEALNALSIDATSVPTDFYEYLNRLYFHGDYDIVFLGSSFTDFDVDWLGYEYWSEYADEPYYNFPNFQNATYDSWRDQLLHSIDYDEVYEAAIEMQKVFVYQCPIIVLYENNYITAYRTDRFEGFVSDVEEGIPNWWTNQKANLIDSLGGPFGGTLRVSNTLDVDTFNVLSSTNQYSDNVLNELYDSLLKRDENGNLHNWLSESYIIETHADNPVVPTDHTRFTFNIVQNATWTDNFPLTAQDIAFTYNYIRDNSVSAYSTFTNELYAVYAPTDYTFVMEFTTESYWHISSFAEIPILPKHQWAGQDPFVFSPDWNELITSGPYFISNYVAGDYIELTKYANYFLIPIGSTGGGVPPNAVPPVADTPSLVEEELVETFANRFIDNKPLDDKMDPVLREFMMSGYLDENVVTTNENRIKIMLFMAPNADYSAVKKVVDVNWRMDMRTMQVISTSVETVSDLKNLESIEGITYIQADTHLTRSENDETIEVPAMYEIGDVVGRTGTYAGNYDGSGVVVGVVDDGTDFSIPDLKDAHFVDTDGNPGSFDPSGWGMTQMYVANYTTVDNVTEWLMEGHLLTYVSGGVTYLNTTGWDPVVNNNGAQRSLMGLLPPYGDGYPSGDNVGFIGLYEYFWGINNASEFVYNEMWKDWEIPGGATENYTFGWAFQQHYDEYAKVFAPSMIYEGKLVIDWNATLAWNSMWNYAMFYETIDLNVTADRDWIAGMMDWNFTDDFDNGDVYGVGTGNNPVLSVDFDNDGMDDIGIGSLTWAYDGFGFLDSEVEDFFCGIESNNLAWAAMFNTGGVHGTWTATAIGSRGIYDHPDIYEDGRSGTEKLPGIANGSKIIAVKGLTSGDDYGAMFWAAGFHLATDGNFTYSVEGVKHKSQIISNSWGYTDGAYQSLSYLTLCWDLMSAPGIIDPSYPGVLFLVSAGNSGADYMSNGAPDSAYSVVSVGGTIVTHAYDDLYEDNQIQLNQEAWFASNGPSFVGIVKPDVVAPSVFGRSPNAFHNVWLDIGNSSRWWSGTSLACPIAAGVAAMIVEAYNDTHGVMPTPQTIKNILLSTADDIGVDPFIQGHGQVNADAAIKLITNGNGYFFESDSLSDYTDIMTDAWAYWMLDWAPYSVWQDETLTSPVGLESSSIFFGNVYRSGTSTVEFIASNGSATFESGDFSNFDPWYYVMNEQFTYEIETRAHTDTNFYNILRGDIINITNLLSSTEMTSFNNAPYVTINAGFDNTYSGEIGMRVWDYDDLNTDGVTNFWYNSTYPGDYIQWVSRDTNNCNNLIARLSTTRTHTIGDLFNYTPVIHLQDDNADESSGTTVRLTFTIWERIVDTSISFVDQTGFTDITLNVPATAEYGIHQGSIFVNDSIGFTHEIPYSYMVVFEANGADDEVQTLVDTWGDELTPYESGAISASFDTHAGSKIDGGGHRTFVIDVPTGRSVLVLRAEWGNLGTVVDMHLRDTTYHEIISTDDGYGPPFNPNPTSSLKNTIIWDPGEDINGTYYLEVSVHTFNATAAFENITITLQTYSSLPTPTVDPTWTSNDSPTPASFSNGATLTGDHVVIQNIWSISPPANLPEYNITNTQLSLLSGLYYENTGTLTDPQGVDDWPVPLNGNNFHWETVDGIHAGDSVYVEMQSVADPSFAVYEWTDLNSDGEVQYDTELGGSAFLSIDSGGAGYTESGTFTAPNDMSIAIQIFTWAWAWHAGDEYTIIVDTRVSIDVNSVDETVSYDTYELGRNATMTVQYTAWTDTDASFVHDLGDVTFNNFFAPDVTVISPNGGETWTGTNFITWSSTSQNVDYDPDTEVYVSNDGGQTFQLIARGLNVTSLQWNVSDWQIMDSYLIKVQTIDRGMIGNDISDSTFTAGELPIPDSAPFISGSDSIGYNVGETGNEVSWYIVDHYPDIIEVWVENVLVATPAWTTPTITITQNCDGHSGGTYNYTVYARDSNGNGALFTTWVYVVDSDITPPTIDSPEDIVYFIGETGNNIEWHADDENPQSYNIDKNGTEVKYGLWNSSSETISISVDGLAEGVYIYSIEVYDYNASMASDEVLVTVTSDTVAPTINSPPDMEILLDDTGSTIEWDPNDINPENYSISRDGIIIKTGLWNSTSENISISLDGLSIGVYIYTIEVFDISGNSVSDEVQVTVILDETVPTINHPPDVDYEEGETGNRISWIPADDHPATYTITRNGTLIQSGEWETLVTINIDVDGLSVGVYEYTIIVVDVAGNTAVDSVIVTVLSTVTSDTTPTDSTSTTTTVIDFSDFSVIISIIITIGSVIVIVVVIMAIIRARRMSQYSNQFG